MFFHRKQKPYRQTAIACLDQDGNEYDAEVCKQVDELYAKIEDDVEEKNRNGFDFTGLDYEQYVQQKFETFIESDPEAEKRVKRSMFKKSMIMQCIQNGCNRLSDCALGNTYIEFPGGMEEFPGGYTTLIEFLTANIPESTIKLNHAVERISKDGDNLAVKCQSGHVFHTKHVIVTCSLGVLKTAYKTLFEPGLLDDSKTEAINKLAIGLYLKVYLVYEDLSFFPPSIDAIHLISFGDDQPDSWLSRLPELDRVYENVLRIRLIGDCAPDVEKLSDEELGGQITEHIRRLLKTQDVPLPKRIIRLKAILLRRRKYWFLYSL